MQLTSEPIVIPAVGLRIQSFSRRRHIDLRRVASCICCR
jgi:hypothetical protein